MANSGIPKAASPMERVIKRQLLKKSTERQLNIARKDQVPSLGYIATEASGIDISLYLMDYYN